MRRGKHIGPRLRAGVLRSRVRLQWKQIGTDHLIHPRFYFRVTAESVSDFLLTLIRVKPKLKRVFSCRFAATCSISSPGLILWDFNNKNCTLDTFDKASICNSLMLCVFLVFFLPVSKKKELRLYKFSKWKQLLCYVIPSCLSLLLFDYSGSAGQMHS